MRSTTSARSTGSIAASASQRRVRGEFAQQDIVNSEQPDAEVGGDLGEADFGDAGRVLVDNRRMRASLRPSMSFELSPRRELQFERRLHRRELRRRDSPARRWTTRTADVAAGLRARASTSASSLIDAAARRALRHRDRTRCHECATAPRCSGTRAPPPRRAPICALGAQNVEFSDGESEIAWIAGAGVSFLIGRNELFTDLSRNVGPSSAGVVVTRDQLRVALDARHDATPEPAGRSARHARRRRRPGVHVSAAHLRHRRRRPAVALAGGVLAARRLRLHLAGIRRRSRRRHARAARWFPFIYQPVQRRRARND